jgi:hypothetical protein
MPGLSPAERQLIRANWTTTRKVTVQD